MVSKKVLESVSKKFGIGKKFRIRFRSDFGFRHTLILIDGAYKLKKNFLRNMAFSETTSDLIGPMPRLLTVRLRTRTCPEVRSWSSDKDAFLPISEIRDVTQSVMNTLATLPVSDFERSLRTQQGQKDLCYNSTNIKI